MAQYRLVVRSYWSDSENELMTCDNEKLFTALDDVVANEYAEEWLQDNRHNIVGCTEKDLWNEDTNEIVSTNLQLTNKQKELQQ